MIGTKVVVGYDGKAVKSGFSDIDKHAKNLGKGLFNFSGIGGIGKMVAGVTALGAALKLVTGGKEMLDYGGQLNDLSFQTGMAVDDLVVLQEAFKATGIESDAAMMAMSKFAKNIQEARDTIKPKPLGEGELIDPNALNFELKGVEKAFALMKLSPFDLDPNNLKKSLEMVANATKSLPHGQQEEVTMALLGKSGAKFQRVFNDFSGTMAMAEKSRPIGKMFKDSISDIDDFGDALGRIPTKINALYLVGFQAAQEVFGKKFATEGLDNLFSTENVMTFKEIVIGALKSIREVIEKGDMFGFLATKMKSGLREMGNEFGKGIGDAFGISTKSAASTGQSSAIQDGPNLGKFGMAAAMSPVGIGIPFLEAKVLSGLNEAVGYLKGIYQDGNTAVFE